MYWCCDQEVNKERFCQQNVRSHIQHSETHRPNRERGNSVRFIRAPHKTVQYTEQPVIMGFPIGDLFRRRSFLLGGAQTCQLFENDLMATCKRSKEINSDFKART